MGCLLISQDGIDCQKTKISLDKCKNTNRLFERNGKWYEWTAPQKWRCRRGDSIWYEENGIEVALVEISAGA